MSFAIKHLRKFDSPCLIRMPTGTGKTGVIASLTALSCQGVSLVVTPWANLRNQLIADLNERFWKKVGIEKTGPNAEQLLPSNAESLLASLPASKILVSTFATLTTLRRKEPAIYEDLASTLSLVLVDECHYEPAVGWGRSIKELKTKTVLLTATPYRNDLKLFQIGNPKRTTLHFTHAEAEKKGIIRKLKLKKFQASGKIETLSLEFAKVWSALLKAGSLPSSEPRAIVCCDTDTNIETTVRTLRGEGLDAIGIHERFKSRTEDYLRKSVPEPKDEKSPIWVHQNKLTEGLDDHRFCVLALFAQFSNDRKLVQQIGRVLRTDSDDKAEPAVVLHPSEFTPDQDWNAYREFEGHQELLDPAHFRQVVQDLLDRQPEIEYFAGRFLKKFDPGELNDNPQVIVPPSALVRRKASSFKLSDYIENCTDTLNLEDAVILGDDLNAPCQKSKNSALWVYASVSNSALLHRRSFYQIRLETHCVVVTQNYIFIADSKGNLPSEYLDDHTKPVGAATLSKYFDSSFRPTNTSIHNTIPFESAIRGQELRGANLSSIAPSITDRIQICRSTRGRSDSEGESRYVGLGNGRLRKETSGSNRSSHDYKVFIEWAKVVASNLDSSNVSPSRYFSRYMPACDPPATVKPRIISLDLNNSEVAFQFADGEPCACVKTTAEISDGVKKNTFKFQITFGSDAGGDVRTRTIRFTLTYKPEKTKFWLTKDDDSDSIRVEKDGDESKKISLGNYLNSNQDSMLICLDGGEIVYQGQSFYAVDYSYAEKALLECIATPQKAKACKTEKGTKAEIAGLQKGTQKRFTTGTLFKEVAEERVDLPFKPEVIICDDMGSEAADFIAADFTNRKLAFLHVKCGSGSNISASAFHDVTAQAMKNLCYMVPAAETPQGVKNSWTKSSKWNNTKIARLYKTRAKFPTATVLWDKIRSEILQASDRELYVILVTSGCVSQGLLGQAIKNPKKRTHETAQLIHLLDGLNSQARQLGVTLLVKDIPYKP